jgi:hypothetical protein
MAAGLPALAQTPGSSASALTVRNVERVGIVDR